jgi:hypothetical protein
VRYFCTRPLGEILAEIGSFGDQVFEAGNKDKRFEGTKDG